MSPSPRLHQHTDVYSSALSPTSASGMTGTFWTFVYDKLCDKWPPPTSPPPFPPSSSHPLFFFPPLRFLPLPFVRPPASAPAAGSLPTAEDVSAQRRCVFPGDGEPARLGACWWWSEPEWAERPQEKPHCTFVCRSSRVGVNPRPMGQRSVSCISNNGRVDASCLFNSSQAQDWAVLVCCCWKHYVSSHSEEWAIS